MPQASEASRAPKNQLLAALPAEDRDRLVPLLRPVCMSQNDVIASAGGQVHYVYFPEGCLGSIVVTSRMGDTVEAALVGVEGVTAFPDVLGRGISIHTGIVQSPGRAFRMDASDFRDEFRRGGAFHDVTIRYLQYLMAQMAQVALCNRVHSLDQRLAKWLLLTSDGLQSHDMQLTQEFIATMLGVHRPGVTGSAHALKEAESIDYTRGRITITNRRLLESFSCECYAFLREQRNSFLDITG